MTIIQPHAKSSYLTYLITLLVVAVILSSLWLITLYNRLVDLDHGVSDLKKRLVELKSSSAEIKDRTFKLFDSQNLEEVAARSNLIKDRNPQYLEAKAQWFLASQL